MDYASICKECGKLQFRPWGTKVCDECNGTLSVTRTEQYVFEKMTAEQQEKLFDAETWRKYTEYGPKAKQREIERRRAEAAREAVRIEKHLNDLLGADPARYQYAIEILEDDSDGRISKNSMKNTIDVYAEHGWELDHIYASEVGRTSSSYGGVGTNATICQHILIFRKEAHVQAKNTLPEELRF